MSKVSIKEGNRRLLVLAAKLDTLPPERFDYNTWVGSDWEGKADLSCGTTACALGWATTIPEFRKLGLKLVRYGYGTDVVLGDSHTPFGAAQKLFGLMLEDSFPLFSPSDACGCDECFEEGSSGPEPTDDPQYVAMKIRMFVESRR